MTGIPAGKSKINMNFPTELYKQVKRMAIDLDTTVTSLFVEWAEEKVSKHESKKGE